MHSIVTRLRVGSSKIVITPPVGTPLGGNARADNYATGVLQDLHARALYIETEDRAACIVSLDLLMLWQSDADALRSEVANALGIPFDAVMVACVHTHSAPDLAQSLSWSDEKSARDRQMLEPYRVMLRERVREAAMQARFRSADAHMKIRFGHNDQLPHNRRLRMRNGETVMNWVLPSAQDVECALGPIDPQVTVVTFEGDNGILGGIAHFACHPAILAGLNLEISGDYCGLAMETLEQKHLSASGAMLFLQGPAGNINHIDYLHPEDHVRDAGEVVRCANLFIESVEKALAGPAIADEDSDLHFITHDLLLPFREIAPDQLEAARELLARYDGRDLSMADGVPPEINARKILRFEQARQTGRMNGPFATLRDGKVVMPLQVIRIGPLSLAGTPGEIFVEFGMHLKEQLGNRCALIVELANGSAGYIPTPEAFAQGGYESSDGPGFLPHNAGQVIVEQLIELERQTHEG